MAKESLPLKIVPTVLGAALALVGGVVLYRHQNPPPYIAYSLAVYEAPHPTFGRAQFLYFEIWNEGAGKADDIKLRIRPKDGLCADARAEGSRKFEPYPSNPAGDDPNAPDALLGHEYGWTLGSMRPAEAVEVFLVLAGRGGDTPVIVDCTKDNLPDTNDRSQFVWADNCTPVKVKRDLAASVPWALWSWLAILILVVGIILLLIVAPFNSWKRLCGSA